MGLYKYVPPTGVLYTEEEPYRRGASVFQAPRFRKGMLTTGTIMPVADILNLWFASWVG